ncbi:esterase-like activity of phytase family protein [Tianweitania sp. BSSL-BM11]|uniref:Esterase-like activity of phytase family protein n=1 Tax=Tianweitania aestuarii TaxID=2814886 RepID=A0ABS5RXX8_9HYPH|nr:esterase-like activity of phytase family protein [Tianweitania aestuarii]MBS9721893.1 esterase-like activity of phytase family protein [Tianweitania aestuarii]
MPRKTILAPLAASLLLATSLSAGAEPFFDRIATMMVRDNLPDGGKGVKEAVAEIISVSEDGVTLVYTDAPGKQIGMIDLKDPANPKPMGTVAVGGEPTSVKIVGGTAYVAVDQTEDFTKPAGKLVAVDIAAKTAGAECKLPGQPDSVAASSDGAFLAIAMENQRDEDLNDGALPQLPAGSLVTVKLGDTLDCAAITEIALTGLDGVVAADDPEPEFVDINDKGEIALSLQENNAILIIDGITGKVTSHFDAGTVSLDRIDTQKDGVIDLSGSMKDVPREPDGLAWIGDDRIITANEGDWKGGTRGFTIFNRDGTVAFDAGNTLEHEIVSLGHYPEKRNKKGIEIEGVAVGQYGDEDLLFVGSERASVIAVYRDNGNTPELLQVLPGGIGPEGLLAIPQRNLFVTATETDLTEDGGIGGQVVVYERGERPAPAYPTIRSEKGENGLPIAWGALSGLAADPAKPGQLYAVTDSVYGAAPRILTVDATQKPARITAELTVTRDNKPAADLDLEGIAIAEQGGFWLASEGNTKERKNLLLHVDAQGAIKEEIELPADVAATATSSGFEGVTVTGEGDEQLIWLAQQRPWKGDAENEVKLFAYKPATKEWGAVRYQLDPKGAGWVGLSEITAAGDRVILIERDNLLGADAKLKKLYSVALADMKPAPLGGDLPLVEKTVLHDLLPDMQAPKGYVLDKIEGFTIDADGEAFAVTDNDGVDDASGETQFLRLGKL